MQQNPAVRTAFDFFMSKGYSHAQAAGIVGNLMGESSFRTDAVGDGGKAKGIAQWHPDRWEPLTAWAKAQGKDPYDLTTQLEMVDLELRTKETKAFNALMNAKTVDEATAAFIGFERPQGWTPNTPRNGHNYSGRLQFANTAFGLMTGVTPPPVTTLGIGGGSSEYRVGSSGNAVNAMDASAPVVPFTEAELRAQAQEREDTAGDVNLWQATKDAVYTQWSLAQLWQDKPEWAPDPKFQLDMDTMEKLTDGIPERYWDRFSGAYSMEQAEGIRASLEKTLAAEQRLAEMGWGGTALSVAAGLTDPLAWAAAAGVSAASFGVGAPAAIGARFGKAGMAGLSAAEAGAGTALSEAVMAANKPTYEDSEFYWAVGVGMGLGGAFGTLRKNPHTQAEADRLEAIGKQLRDTATGRHQGGSTAGAAQVSSVQPLRGDTSEIVRDAVKPDVFHAPRYDVSYSLKSSDNSLTAMIGDQLVEDAARNKSGITPIGASEVQQWIEITSSAKWASRSAANFRDFKKRNPGASMQQFHEEVTQFTRDRNLFQEYDPAVKAQGAVQREILGDFAEMAANPGVLDGRQLRPLRGFEGKGRNDFYVPRMFDLGAVHNALSKFGHATLVKFMARGVMAVNKEISEEAAEKFMRGYLRKLHGMSAGEVQGAHRAFSGEDLDGLKAHLMDGTDLSELEIDQMIAHMKPQPGDGASRHGKQRAFYDEQFSEVLPTRNGGREAFRISDLFINDADRLMRSYMRTMSGRIAMARLQIRNPKWTPGDAADEFFVNGITSDGEWKTLMDKVIAVGDEMGIKAAKNVKDVERMNWAYDTIVGRRHEGGAWNQALRMARDYNFLRVMGQVGWAQISEFKNTVGHLGVKAAFTNMPSFRSMWRNAMTGKLDDATADEIENIMGVGTDWVRHTSHRRMDVFENPMDDFANPWLKGVDDFQQGAKRVVSAASGMAPINTLLQRWTGRAIYNHFAMLAQGRIKVNPRRLEALGLDAEMAERISESIRQHAKFEGKNVRSMNLDKWADREAVSAFKLGAFRLSRTIIQENDIGGMAMWMSKPLARTFLQFRSFMLQAYTKQFLQGINFRDTGTAVSFIGSTVAAAMVYVARTHANSIGRSDREEYLKKRLELGNIVTAGVQNSTWASIFPPLIDLAASAFTPEGTPLFDARNTQLTGGLFWGNPTADLGNSIITSYQTAGQLARGKRLSQADARTFARMLPFQNLHGIAQLYSGMVRSLPEWTPKK